MDFYQEMEMLKRDRARTVQQINSLQIDFEASSIVNRIIPRHSGTVDIHKENKADFPTIRDEIERLGGRLYLIDSAITRLLWKQKSWEIARLMVRLQKLQSKINPLNKQIDEMQQRFIQAFSENNVLPADLIPVDPETVDEELLDEAATASP